MSTIEAQSSQGPWEGRVSKCPCGCCWGGSVMWGLFWQVASWDHLNSATGSHSLESVCVHGQTPWSFLCLRARQLEEGVKSNRIALKWSGATSKFGLTLKTKPSKYLQTHTDMQHSVSLRTNFSQIYMQTILFAGWITIPLRAEAFMGG